jgi:hypothetical protein
MLAITLVALLPSAPAPFRNQDPAPILARFKKYGDLGRVTALSSDAEQFCGFAREKLANYGEISAAELKRYEATCGASHSLMTALLAKDLKDAKRLATFLERLRQCLDAKDFRAGRIGPPVPGKWEKQYRAWLRKTGRIDWSSKY